MRGQSTHNQSDAKRNRPLTLISIRPRDTNRSSQADEPISQPAKAAISAAHPRKPALRRRTSDRHATTADFLYRRVTAAVMIWPKKVGPEFGPTLATSPLIEGRAPSAIVRLVLGGIELRHPKEIMTKVSVNEIVTKVAVVPDWQRSLTILTFTVVSVVAITILYWGQSIFIPVVLGAFLTFLLSPLVSALRQRGMPRMPAVFITVCLAAVGLGLVGWVVTAQISSLLRELPKYSENIKAKAKSLKQVAASSNGVTRMLVDINQELGSAKPTEGEGPQQIENGDKREQQRDSTRLERVIIEPQSPVWLSRISTFLAPLMEYLGELAWRSSS